MIEAEGRTTTPFTSREEEVLQLLAGLHTDDEMCKKLAIKKGTLQNHFKNIQRKINLYGSRKVLLIRYAAEHGYGKREEASA